MGDVVKKVRIGVIGTGRIAERFVQEVISGKAKDVAVISSVCNPHRESADRFAGKYALTNVTQDPEELAGCCDAVYIASPHETHAEYTEKMLKLGLSVLCEKPMAFTAEKAARLYQLAKEQHCTLMEAVKTAYCPGFLNLIEVAQSGRIGQIRDVEACFSRLTPSNVRELRDLDYGGSFTELGSYTLLPVFRLLGTDYRKLEFHLLPCENGLDVYAKTVFEYPNAQALCKTGLGVKSEGQLLIAGTKGYILAESPWWLTKKFVVRYEDPQKMEQFVYPYEGTGLQYEIQEFCRRVGEKVTENKTVAESIAAAGVMEAFLENRRKEHLEQSLAGRAEGKHLRPEQVKIWGHRGCSMQYPENTLAAFQAAAEIPGIAGIELDIQLTRDGEIVVIHDENILRVTGHDAAVRDLTLQEIRAIPIKGGSGLSEKIPTMEEVLQLLKPYCMKNGLLINIELKTGVVRYEGIEEKILKLIHHYEMEQYIVYSSFLMESIRMIREMEPEAQTGMLACNLEDCITGARAAGADALHPWVGGLTMALPEDMKGLAVRAWNGEEPFYQDGRVLKEKNLRSYAASGVTDIITNVPELYLE